MTAPTEAGAGAAKPLTPRQIEVLRDLLELKARPGQCSRNFDPAWTKLPEHMLGPWATPQDFGGGDGSHHSATAKRLAELGLVDRFNYHTRQLNHFTGKAKGACVYRITDTGIAALTSATGAQP